MILALEEEGHPMKRSRYTEEQIAFALRQAEGGTSIGEVCRKMGILGEHPFDSAQGRPSIVGR
jgi:putative transposase